MINHHFFSLLYLNQRDTYIELTCVPNVTSIKTRFGYRLFAKHYSKCNSSHTTPKSLVFSFSHMSLITFLQYISSNVNTTNLSINESLSSCIVCPSLDYIHRICRYFYRSFYAFINLLFLAHICKRIRFQIKRFQ